MLGAAGHGQWTSQSCYVLASHETVWRPVPLSCSLCACRFPSSANALCRHKNGSHHEYLLPYVYQESDTRKLHISTMALHCCCQSILPPEYRTISNWIRRCQASIGRLVDSASRHNQIRHLASIPWGSSCIKEPRIPPSHPRSHTCLTPSCIRLGTLVHPRGRMTVSKISHLFELKRSFSSLAHEFVQALVDEGHNGSSGKMITCV